MGTCYWTRGPIIGRGSSATVSIAKHDRSGKIFAVKSAELAKSEFLQREQRILSLLDCPRIVSYVGHDITIENGRYFYNLLMEYVDGGTLTERIHRQGGRLDEAVIRCYTRQILQGLAYLHFKGLVHCDVKGRNVLIGSDGATIADLGCAKWTDGSTALKMEIAGTPLYMAPEVARGEEQGFPADIWALGCTVIEMATGRPPWPDVTDPVTALYRIAHSTEVPEFPSWLSELAKDFLNKCLVRCPKDRWTVNQLLEHPFIVDELDYPSKQVVIRSAVTNSPKSTLDQCIWDSLEEDQMDQDPMSHIASSSSSPADGIQGLSSGLSSSGMPNWTWEGSWVSVRRNQNVEISLESQMSVDEQISGSDSVRGSNEELYFSDVKWVDDRDVSVNIPLVNVGEDFLFPVNVQEIFSLLMKIFGHEKASMFRAIANIFLLSHANFQLIQKSCCIFLHQLCKAFMLSSKKNV